MRHEGRMRAGGVEKDVIFMDADANLSDEIGAAYRAKYRPPRSNLRQHYGEP
jgi:hypothetical protein